MITRDRHERNNEDEWPIRPDGFIGAAPVGDCCLILASDPGTNTDEVLLAADTDGTSCVQPASC